MKDTISKRDWETISAYLDGQLSRPKQARLESRLQKDFQLQVALGELRNTRDVLRSAPRLRAPRNFMLTPEMAGHPVRIPRLAPVFGWASAVASFLLVLVLVGDIFNAGRFVPMVNDIPQQSEFVAPRGQVLEDEAPEQPTISGGVDVPLKGSAEEAAPPESAENDISMEVAADPVLESAPMEEPITESNEIEMFAAAADAAPENPDEQVGTTAMVDAAIEAPVETPMGDTEGEVGEPQEDSRSMEVAGILAESASISETVEIESSQEQPTEMPLAEEKTVQPPEEKLEQPSGDVAETHPDSESQATLDEHSSVDTSEIRPDSEAASVEVWTATETLPAAEVTSAVTEIATETTPTHASVSEYTGDFAIGAEVILALFALASGFAWVYMRRRGG
jgi:hypothetical protein